MSNSLKNATDRLHTVLITAQKERDQRPNLVDGPDGQECEWAGFERNAMWQETNRIRAEYGLRPLLLTSILRVELQAVGHSDYSRKYAFYCAELATPTPGMT